MTFRQENHALGAMGGHPELRGSTCGLHLAAVELIHAFTPSPVSLSPPQADS